MTMLKHSFSSVHNKRVNWDEMSILYLCAILCTVQISPAVSYPLTGYSRADGAFRPNNVMPHLRTPNTVNGPVYTRYEKQPLSVVLHYPRVPKQHSLPLPATDLGTFPQQPQREIQPMREHHFLSRPSAIESPHASVLQGYHVQYGPPPYSLQQYHTHGQSRPFQLNQHPMSQGYQPVTNQLIKPFDNLSHLFRPPRNPGIIIMANNIVVIQDRSTPTHSFTPDNFFPASGLHRMINHDVSDRQGANQNDNSRPVNFATRPIVPLMRLLPMTKKPQEQITANGKFEINYLLEHVPHGYAWLTNAGINEQLSSLSGNISQHSVYMEPLSPTVVAEHPGPVRPLLSAMKPQSIADVINDVTKSSVALVNQNSFISQYGPSFDDGEH